MGKKSTPEEEGKAVPEHLRCNRTDGRQWRCRRRVMENLKLCEIHYLQGQHRQHKEKVPESLKLQRKSQNDAVETHIGAKRKGNSREAFVNRRNQLELIRMVLQREAEKKKKKESQLNLPLKLNLHSNHDLRRELPNGVMAIASSSTPNVASSYRYFRSKNVERGSGGKLQVVQCGRNLKKGRRKKCHWCQRSDSCSLIRCSNCQREFFCMDCIKQRYFDTQNEVKMACPVCRGTCTCKDCLAPQYEDSESKEHLAGRNRVDRILHFHYLVCMLLPVLKQIKEDHHVGVETKAKIKGKKMNDIIIKPVKFGCNEKNYCNHCKTPILDLHKGCLSCSYSLCLSCSRALSQRRISEQNNSSISKQPDRISACTSGKRYLLDEKAISHGNLTDTSMLTEWTSCNGASIVSCPTTKLGDCGNSHLDLNYVFPLSWIKEMEAKAEEIICSYDFPETLDKSSSCPMCVNKDHKTSRYKQLPEAAQREDSNDNYLFYPTVLDIGSNHFEHFQKHWGRGHPVVVRDVLQSTPNLSWDPLFMFCTYLERSMTRYENNKDLLEACLDWFEVETNVRQYFTGSLKCQPKKNTWHEMLKLKGWLSSQLFKEQFPAHFAEVIDALPIQEYMNPSSGLLNLAANLPQGSTMHDIGPYVYISYGCADDEAESVTNLCYDSYDMVNVMAHSMDIPLSTDQLSRISKLLKKHKVLCQKVSSKTTTDHAEDREQNEMQSLVREGTDFLRRVNRTSCISCEAKTICNQNLDNNISGDKECGSYSETEKAHRSLSFHSIVLSSEMFPDHNPRNSVENSDNDKRKKATGNAGAQWDVFRRQDVPKLLEYLKIHSDEFSYTSEHHEKMVHPLLDQSFFLDNTHKMRLKEEFKIEPWTFEQHVGEAVIIPSGCPYQIRNPKCCVRVELEFVSPENVAECIQLIDEARLLPEDHPAKVEKLEVKKMALHSMNTAIKEICELTCRT
ncbi:lysine-specific demethylase JMJ25-like isoform X3 [Vigna umbellata]|uniref:lysine-specific demethylase JMJ25-like isoform X3 n=1 Tax=Vigna umbellata TaxID=87088 RepID=UPI001F5E9E80|nr:lysine-specific demethylase JMJ25-like isoform X3 [Vigna umbellata]